MEIGANSKASLWRPGTAGKNGAEPINSFALVTYVAAPLGRFLDELRCDLVPDCLPRAHVTILPPRPLSVPPREAWGEVCLGLRDLPLLEIEAGDVGVFRDTNVIYIELGRGRRELERLHDSLNKGPLAFAEPFAYHPHITLAQQIGPAEVAGFHERACRRWAEFSGSRRFTMEVLTFVQNTTENRWLDLAQYSPAVAFSR